MTDHPDRVGPDEYHNHVPGCRARQGNTLTPDSCTCDARPGALARLGDAPRAVMGASGDRRARGLYRKFDVIRTDGTDAIGGKHHGCNYFVLDVTHDPFAIPALSAYADACQETYPALAGDLRELIGPQLKERSVLPDIELVAAAVHDAWMQQKRAKGITSAPSQSTGEEQMRPYAELSNEVQEYDRATVRAVYEAIERAAAGVGGAQDAP